MSLSSTVETPRPVRLGSYDVVRRLGEGGMAKVFEGRHIALGTRVALKVLSSRDGSEESAVRRILREGRIAAAVRHPNVVSVIDVGREGEVPFLVMELLEGEDLAKLLARRGPLGAKEIAELLLPVAAGVSAVHAEGIIHRDLKPSNILLARRHGGMEPVVVDFGISRSTVLPDPSRSTSHAIAGTMHYMAPEQVRGSADLTPKTDQYALGVIAYECATGGTPFWGDDTYELLHAIMTAEVVPPSRLNPRIPPEFDEAVLRALARHPEDRFPDVASFARALTPFRQASDRQERSRAPSAAQSATARSHSLELPRERRRSIPVKARTRWAIPVGIAATVGATALLMAMRAEGPRNANAFEAPNEPLPSPTLEERPLAKEAAPLEATPRVIEQPAPRQRPKTQTAQRREPLTTPQGSPPPATSRPSAPVRNHDRPPAPRLERGTANVPIIE